MEGRISRIVLFYEPARSSSSGLVGSPDSRSSMDLNPGHCMTITHPQEFGPSLSRTFPRILCKLQKQSFGHSSHEVTTLVICRATIVVLLPFQNAAIALHVVTQCGQCRFAQTYGDNVRKEVFRPVLTFDFAVLYDGGNDVHRTKDSVTDRLSAWAER